jgi:hypothetical protein
MLHISPDKSSTFLVYFNSLLGSDKPGFENLAKALASILDSLINANEVKSALRNGIAETSPNIQT